MERKPLSLHSAIAGVAVVLLHQDLIELLKNIKKNGQKTLVTLVHHNMKEIHHVVE